MMEKKPIAMAELKRRFTLGTHCRLVGREGPGARPVGAFETDHLIRTIVYRQTNAIACSISEQAIENPIIPPSKEWSWLYFYPGDKAYETARGVTLESPKRNLTLTYEWVAAQTDQPKTLHANPTLAV